MGKMPESQKSQSCPQLAMVTLLLVLPFMEHEAALMASVMSMPSFNFPEPTCLLSSHSGLAVQIRNWGLFVYCSVLARTKFSPSNLSLQVDSLPAPLQCAKLPPWHMNPERGSSCSQRFLSGAQI